MSGLVSVVIPNYNDRENLGRCLGSLAVQDYPGFEVIVVDDGSSDGSPDMVRDKFPEVRLIDCKVNRGFSTVVNTGIDASLGELVCLLNSDTEADTRWLSELARAADRYPDAGFFATKMIFHADRATIDTFGDGFSVAGFGYKRGWGEPSGAYTEYEYVLGACGGAAMYRRSLLDEVRDERRQCFDVDFFAFAEDLDISLRAQLLGHRCIAVPGAVVYHKVRGAWGRKSERAIFLSHRNFILCVMKSFPAFVILRNLPAILCYNLLAGIADMLKNRRLLYFRSYIAAIGMWRNISPKRKAIQAGRRVSPSEFQKMLTRPWLPLWLKLGRMSRAVSRRGL